MHTITKRVHEVILVKLVTGDALWTKINTVPNQYPYLKEDITCDVAIVGAGVTGALCGYKFAKDKIDTILIDKNIIGYGSTRACTAILEYAIDTNLHELSAMIGKDNAVTCFKETEKGLYEINRIVDELDDDCGFKLKDSLYYTYKDNDINTIKNEFELRKNSGFNVSYVDAKGAKDKFSFAITGGIYSHKLVGEIDPYRFTHALIRKGVEHGLRVFENTEAIEVRSTQDGITIKTPNEFTIKAKKVIMAKGYEMRKYFKKTTAILTRSFNIVTNPIENPEGWFGQCVIRDMDDPYIYIRETVDHRIIMGGEDESLGGDRSKMSCLEQNDPLSKQKYQVLLDKLTKLFPQIRGLEIAFAFSGYFGETKDGLPYIGEHHDYPNHYFCMAYGSNGIINGVLGASLIKDLYRGKHSKLHELFDMER